MKSLLIIKEHIKKFVGKNEVFILPILKFLLTYMAINQINTKLGFQARLASSAITLIIALAGSFLPMNLTLVILALVVIAHVYAISLECTILVLALFLIMFLFYFRFASKDAVGTMLVPLSFVFKIPYVIPVSLGLVGTPSSMVSTGCGVITYYVLHYISENAASLKHELSDMEISTFKETVDAVLVNKTMFVFVIAFSATVLVVYIIRRLSIPYAWTIAIFVGTMACFIMTLMFNSALGGNVSGGEAFLGVIISIILNTFLQYFLFDLDYNRVERVQFEDDEYYYYVKAVPKNTIKLSDNGKKKKGKAPVKKDVKKTAPLPQRTRPSATAEAKEEPRLRGDDLIEEIPVRRTPVNREGVTNVTRRPGTSAPVKRSTGVPEAERIHRSTQANASNRPTGDSNQ